MPTLNIKTHYSAVGNAIGATEAITITGGTTLTATNPHWSTTPGAEVGKLITIQGAGPFGATLYTTIAGVTSTTQITLGNAASVALSGSTQFFVWGTNDADKFLDFRNDNQDVSNVVLEIPAGGYMLAPVDIGDNFLFKGIPGLIVNGTGSPTLYNSFILGQFAGFDEARIYSASAGATSIQMMTPGADAAPFAPGYTHTIASINVIVGDWTNNTYWVRLTALDLQGYGDPINAYFYEYVEVTGFNSTTGVFTLATPLQNSYDQNYPQYDTPKVGPGYVMALDKGFNYPLTINDVNFDIPDGQTFITMNGGDLTYDGCTFIDHSDNAARPNPTTTNEVVFRNCIFQHGLEMDKLNYRVTLDNCTVNGIGFQSPVPYYLHVTNGTAFTSLMNGTPRNVIASDSTFSSISFGCTGYGGASSFTATGCTIGSVQDVGLNSPNVITTPPMTVTDGVFRHPISLAAPLTSVVPGIAINWGGQYTSERNFVVGNSITKDATYTYFNSNTTLDALPTTLPLAGGTDLGWHVHPCPNLTLTDCDGCDEIDDWSQEGARGLPMFSYSKRVYDGSTQLTSGGPVLWGDIVHIKITVLQGDEFTADGGSLTLDLSRFGNTHLIKSDYTLASDYTITVNMREYGERVIAPGGNTGAKPGDVLTPLPDTSSWMVGEAVRPFLSRNVGAANLSFTIEILTDQGIDTVTPTPTPHTRRSIEIHGGTYRYA